MQSVIQWKCYVEMIIHLFLEVYDWPYLFREILSDISVMVITSISALPRKASEWNNLLYYWLYCYL